METLKNKQYVYFNNQHYTTHPKDVTRLTQLREKTHWIFHSAELTKIQVVNKNFKRLNKRSIYCIFKAINESKGIQRRPGSGRKSIIVESIFEITKKWFEIDNGLTTSQFSNKIFELKRSQNKQWRCLVSHN